MTPRPQKMLRDDRFAGPFESNDETLWLTTQLLDALPPMTVLPDEVQVEVMRVSVDRCPTSVLLFSLPAHIVNILFRLKKYTVVV